MGVNFLNKYQKKISKSQKSHHKIVKFVEENLENLLNNKWILEIYTNIYTFFLNSFKTRLLRILKPSYQNKSTKRNKFKLKHLVTIFN